MALRDDGALLGKVGVNGAWVTLATGGIDHFQLEGTRIAVIRDDGALLAKDDMNASWAVLASSNTSRIVLDGNFIGWLSQDNQFRIKRGLNAPWSDARSISGEVIQMDPIVRRPVKPARISEAGLVDARENCILDTGGAPCYPDMEDEWRFAPYYGRFCGSGRPSTDFWSAAMSYGPMDPMDHLCMYHDNAPDTGSGWYLWDESTGNWCIVNHGLYNSRLTENGTLLAVGGHYQTDYARWDNAWAGRMFSLKNAVEVYLDKTSACDRAAYEATIP